MASERTIDIVANTIYFLAAILFFVGSILFITGADIRIVAWIFIVGSAISIFPPFLCVMYLL